MNDTTVTPLQDDAAAAGTTVTLSLVSHTNVGKTTLARTLLGRDIGEVRDEAHVTQEVERHTMIESLEGDRLELWDTPGFGDSVRLARRIAQAGNPLGWFLSEVWDRFRDRAFWASQKVVRHVLDQSDVVLYLVNASEAPEDAGYLDAELRVLELAGKPVIVLLNQLGSPREPELEAAEVERWQRHIQSTRDRPVTHGGASAAPSWRGLGEQEDRRKAPAPTVLALDAFARCWAQEGTLLEAVSAVLANDEQRAAMERLRHAWWVRGQATWQAAMAVLAERLARAAQDRQVVASSGFMGKLKEVGAALGLRREGSQTPRELAMRGLAERLDADIRASTARLIRLHGLSGEATGQVLMRLAEHFSVRQPLSEGKAAVWGGVLSGALAGLKADVLSGGLTMGGGLLAGGVLGALGAAGLARGYNVLRGVDEPTLAWADAVLDELARSALLGYLAVAHYGRGRGDWQAWQHPEFWQDSVDDVVEQRLELLHDLWAERHSLSADELAAKLEDWLSDACDALLARLYPEHRPLLPE